MPVIIIGSIFLIFYVLGSPSVGNSGKALVPLLTPLSSKFAVVNSLTMGFLGLYASMTISMYYAEALGVDTKSGSVLGLVTFILLNLNGTTPKGFINASSFGAVGLIAAILVSFVSIRIYKFCIDKKIAIRLPDSVPPNIGNSFSALIPYFITFTIAWIIRTIFDFDIISVLTSALKPVFSAADNIFTYTLRMTIVNTFWAVGLHGDNMFDSPIFQPFALMWTADNAKALADGVKGTELPHIMTSQGLDRMTNWTACVWPLILLMVTSKVKYLKTLGWACLPSAIFTIVEPVIFGLPLALNPFLIIPFILTGIVTAIVSYGTFALGFISRFYTTLPWATPPFILGPLGTGDWKSEILVVVSFLIGLIIYYPFFKQFEKHELAKENREIENNTR